MIPRFWNPTSGRILIDGYDTRDITLKSLRKQIAIVSQDVILFDDTIRNNIAYGVPNASEEQINKAIDDAALREFIDALPKGLRLRLAKQEISSQAGRNSEFLLHAPF